MNRPSSLTENTAASEPAARYSCPSIHFFPEVAPLPEPLPQHLRLVNCVGLLRSPSSCIAAGKFSPFQRCARLRNDHEAEYSPGVSHHQGGDDGRQRIHHP